MRYLVPFSVLFVFAHHPWANAEEWVAHSIDHQGKGADGIRFADINGDTLLDIASGWEEAGETRIYLNPGNENVSQAWPKVVVGKTGPVEDAAFCDLDADGFVDVISSSENKNIYVHWAPKSHNTDLSLDPTAWVTEVLPASQGLQNWMFAIPIQIDGKHGCDILAAGKGNKVVWFESPPDARKLSDWKMHVISDKGGWTMGMAAIDMDRDGDLDVLLGIRDKNPGVKWLENPGIGPEQTQFWKVHSVGDPEPMGFVSVSDLDHDGFLDVVSPSMGGKAKSVNVFFGCDGKSTRWQALEIALPKPRNKGIAVGDIDLDGHTDLVVSHEFAEIYVLRQNGRPRDNQWEIQTIASGGKFDDVTLYDVDQDGDLDVFTTDEKGLQVVWYENPGK